MTTSLGVVHVIQSEEDITHICDWLHHGVVDVLTCSRVIELSHLAADAYGDQMIVANAHHLSSRQAQTYREESFGRLPPRRARLHLPRSSSRALALVSAASFMATTSLVLWYYEYLVTCVLVAVLGWPWLLYAGLIVLSLRIICT